ncbi:MAG: hypothetical protein J4N95_04965 [Chloroflexi bacterium]|nr:hypothetical protein [Chloroflexota bacterium]
MPATRPYQPSDRTAAIEALGDARAVDQTSHRIVVADAGPAAGIALWTEPGPGGEPYLGDVKLPGAARRLFYQLIEACAQDALDRGYEHASFTVHDATLLSLIQGDFTIEPQPTAWDPGSGRAASWDIRVNLQDALVQLRRVLDA